MKGPEVRKSRSVGDRRSIVIDVLAHSMTANEAKQTLLELAGVLEDMDGSCKFGLWLGAQDLRKDQIEMLVSYWKRASPGRPTRAKSSKLAV
ncbi:MAG: hypothetical protein JRN67_10845 [Nitrososphaerota archaeon]|nr:hypothetical protein [Nitrososphaerota archaeon]